MGKRGGARRPVGPVGAGLALLLAAFGLAAGCASGPPVAPGRMPGTLVQDGFRGREVVARWAQVDVTAGAARPAYLYTPDHRFALVANAPERQVADLNPQAGSWEVTCFAEGSGIRCRLMALGEEKRDGVRQVALTVAYDPQGQGTTLCVGPPGAKASAIRVGEHGEWREAGQGGCFPPGQSNPLLGELKSANQLGYRYKNAGAETTGWRPAYGLGVALDLMQWMYARVTSA